MRNAGPQLPTSFLSPPSSVLSNLLLVADDDGVVFVDAARWPEVEAIAGRIVADERRQAELIAGGTSLRSQLDFAAYIARRADDPAYTLRQHLL